MTSFTKSLLAAGAAFAMLSPIAAAPAAAQIVRGIGVVSLPAVVANSNAYKVAEQQRPVTYKPQLDQAEARRKAITAQLQPLVDKFNRDRQAPGANSAALQQQAQQIQQIQQSGEQELRTILQPVGYSEAYVQEQIAEKLDAAVVAETGNDTAVARRVETRYQQAARLHERSFEVHRFSDQPRRRRIRRYPGPIGQIADARVLGHNAEDTRVQQRAGRADALLRDRSTRLENGQGRGYRDLSGDEDADRFAGLGAVDVQFLQAGRDRSAARALIGLFIGDVFGVREQAVLKVVDADLSRFLKTDRAQMARDLETAFVRLFHGGSQFVTGDVHVGLERCGSLVCPEVDLFSGIFHSAQLVHHGRERSTAFQIWRCDVHFRADHSTGVDPTFCLEIGEWGDTAGRPDRRHTER